MLGTRRHEGAMLWLLWNIKFFRMCFCCFSPLDGHLFGEDTLERKSFEIGAKGQNAFLVFFSAVRFTLRRCPDYARAKGDPAEATEYEKWFELRNSTWRFSLWELYDAHFLIESLEFRRLLFVACCLLFVVCCLLCVVVCCLLFVVCCLLFVVCCLLCGVWCVLFVVCCLSFVVCCLLLFPFV